MKRLMALLLSGLLLLTAGCGKQQEPPTPQPQTPDTQPQSESQPLLPEDFPLELYFSSGAGGWRSVITLAPDGTFTGQFTDSEAGSVGEDYPYGSLYLCDFSGRFGDIRQMDPLTYALTLEELNILTEQAEPWIEEGIRYVPSSPYGLEDSEEFRLYLPDTAAADLSENARSGWPHMGTDAETLGCYALHNVAQDQVFYDWSFWALSDTESAADPSQTEAEASQSSLLSDETENLPPHSGEVLSVYETGGVLIRLPAKYLDQLLITTGDVYDEALSSHFLTLMTVRERASVEAAEADFGSAEGLGFLFGIELLDQLGFEELVQYDFSGCSVFARDDTHYYAMTYPTDVQFYRSGGNYDEDLADWEALNTLGTAVCQDIIDQNGLTPYSQRDLYLQAFTYEGNHVYVNFYPYFTMDGSRDNFYTLVLSQPAKQGAGGIWCVERILDAFGSTTLIFPQAEVPAAEHYTARQAAHDAGLESELLTPLETAEAYLRQAGWFSGELAQGSLEEMTVVDSDYMDTNRKLHEVIPALLTGSGVEDEDLLECIGDFRPDTWGVLGRTYYGSNWWPALLEALEDTALGDNQELRCGSMMRFYLTCYGQYETAVRNILDLQQEKAPKAFDAALNDFVPEQQARLMDLTLS